MTEKKLFLVHTSASLVPMFEQLCKTKLPGVIVCNMVDDSLIKDVIAHGCLRPQTAKRVTQLVAAAEDAGADYILVTCSSIGKAVETAAGLSLVPVLRVDPREKNGYRFWSARRWRSIIWRRFSRNPLGD